MAADGGYLIARGRTAASTCCAGPTSCAPLGARPLTAAATVTRADELPPGAEANQLRETAWLTATELQLTWLLRAL